MAISYVTTTANDFNMTLMVGEPPTEVVVQAGDFSKVAADGLHFTLPDGTKVQLGKFSELIAWINTKFEITLPVTAGDDWPETIKSIFNGVTGATVTVTILNIDQDKKDADGAYPPMDVQLSLTAKASPAIELIKGLFSVSGAGVGVKRTHSVKA
jgi:hypothetical protein